MRGGEPQRALEGAGGAGRPGRGRGGSCRRSVPGSPFLLSVRSVSGAAARGPGRREGPELGRPGRRRQGQSQPRPRTEPVDCGWACGRRTGGARAGCGRERGHCVPHPPTPRGVMAQTHFPRASPRTWCPRPSLLRGAEDCTSLPSSFSCMFSD